MGEITSDSDRNGAVAWSIIEPYWETVSIYDGPDVFLQGFGQLPEPARHLFAVWWCDYEVCNGGFDQFFSNSTGVLAPEALEGFRVIGLAECAEIIAAAISMLGEPYPRDRGARHSSLQAIRRPGKERKQWDPFYELNGSYYAAKERAGFHQKLDAFARRYAE